MSCDEIRDLLPRWADRDEGGLSDEERRLVASHLETCPGCRQALKELEVVTSMVRALPPIGVPWSVEHRARELGHFRVQRITTERPLEVTAALQAMPPREEAVLSMRRGQAVPSAIGAAGDEAAPAPMAPMAAPRARRVWVVVAIVAAVVAVLAALAYWLLR
jgi:hypothetical protein